MDSDSSDEVVLLAASGIVARRNRTSTRLYMHTAHEVNASTRFRTPLEYLRVSDSALNDYCHLSATEFEELLGLLGNRLSHPHTHRHPVSAKNRLLIFLRHVAKGVSYSTLKGEFNIGKSTAKIVIEEVADAVISELHFRAFPQLTKARMYRYMVEMRRKTGYPCGTLSMDGKHIPIVAPNNSGSEFYNYKQFFSIVLLVAVNVNAEFITYDIGAAGRMSDSQIFNNSNMKILLLDDSLYPPHQNLGQCGQVPVHVLADGGFALHQRVMRPFSNQESAADPKKAYFNNKYSGVRRIVECAFGILSGRFRVLRQTQTASPETVQKTVLATMILHNLMVNSLGTDAVRDRFADNSGTLQNVSVQNSGVMSRDAKIFRDRLANFFWLNRTI